MKCDMSKYNMTTKSSLTLSKSFITSSVNSFLTLSAWIFSLACAGVDAPIITDVTFGFFKHQAIPSWAGVQPIRLAII